MSERAGKGQSYEVAGFHHWDLLLRFAPVWAQWLIFLESQADLSGYRTSALRRNAARINNAKLPLLRLKLDELLDSSMHPGFISISEPDKYILWVERACP